MYKTSVPTAPNVTVSASPLSWDPIPLRRNILLPASTYKGVVALHVKKPPPALMITDGGMGKKGVIYEKLINYIPMR
jgi:hypothetical protein